MDQPLLAATASMPPARKIMLVLAALGTAITALALAACSPFEDPLLELDPGLRDSTLQALPALARGTVPRLHLLESFGSYGCVSCPDAESRLSPYMHADQKHPGYYAGLVIVNYHVKFGSIADPWITPATQAWNDRRGYVSLPQSVMDGSNAPYGIREKDVAFKEGEYDSLIARAHRSDSVSSLELRIDTAGIVYDTAVGTIKLTFRAANLGDSDLGPLSFRVLAVKNKPAQIPIYPTPWEVIVAEMTLQDAEGKPMALSSLPALTEKSFRITLATGTEKAKHPRPPPLGTENASDYALVVAAEGKDGRVVNSLSWRYAPR